LSSYVAYSCIETLSVCVSVCHLSALLLETA
jgi:hypothetical protein